MANEQVSLIKDKIPIEELISEYIKLEKAGANLKGLCPFHNEKTPSFHVSPERNAYYCFGCGAKGDIFTFVEEFDGVDFKTALRTLAEKAGVELGQYTSKDASKREKQLRIVEGATKFYQKHLVGNKEAQKYLRGRGLEKDTILEWRIGLAPEGWRSVHDFLKTKDVKVGDMEGAGLVKKGEKGSYYDRFRNRVMFPIFDSQGRPIAFSGRTLSNDKDEAKYINSPETDLFNKSEVLYGFNFAKGSIRKLDFSIVVEGQMDVIMSHQAGYTNTVATSGTALTDSQLEKLDRISHKLVIALDGDGAGLKASERAWKIALARGMDVKVATLPEGKDPADVIQERALDWKEIIRNSKHIIDFVISVIDKQDVPDRTKLRDVKKQLLPYIANLDSAMEQAHFVQKVSDIFNIPVASVWDDIGVVEVEDEKEDVVTEVEGSKKSSILDEIFTIILWKESLGEGASDMEEEISKLITPEKYKKFHTFYAKDKDKHLFQAELKYKDLSLHKVQDIFTDLLISFKKKLLAKKRAYYQVELSKAEAEKDEKKVSEILGKIQGLSAEME